MVKNSNSNFYKMDPEKHDFSKDEWIKSGTQKKILRCRHNK